jgi:hypothetical protein
VSSPCISKRLFDNAGLSTTKPRESALRAVTKEVVGIRVLLTRLVFGDGIPRKLLRRASAVKSTSALKAAQNESSIWVSSATHSREKHCPESGAPGPQDVDPRSLESRRSCRPLTRIRWSGRPAKKRTLNRSSRLRERKGQDLGSGSGLVGATQGTLRYDPKSRLRPPDDFRFQYWPWQFPDKIDRSAAFFNALQAENFRFYPFGKSRGSKSRRLVCDKAHPSSNPRVLTRRCCDRFRSVGCLLGLIAAGLV